MIKEINNPSKCPICGRPTHKESKYCIFHASAEEKTEEEFKKALKSLIDKTIQTSKELNFEKFIFKGDIDFSKDFNLTELQESNFENTESYYGKISFDNSTFLGETKFINCKFVSKISFINSKFKSNLCIIDVRFLDQVNFSKASFQSVEIINNNFEGGIVSFNGAIFFGNLLVEHCKFKHHDIDFRHSKFHGNVKMGGKILYQNNFDFEGADINYNFELFFTSKVKIEIKLNNITNYPNFTKISIAANNANVYFNNANLEKTELLFELYDNFYIDFEKAKIKDTYLKYSHIKESIIQEKNKNYEEAKEIYLMLKNNFHSIGRYNDESLAFKKEMDMERASHWIHNMKYNKPILKEWLLSGHFKKWFCSAFSNMIYGYGERPRNVIFSAIFIIILFSVFFSFLGINSPEIIEMKSPAVQDIFNSNSEIISKGNLINKTTNYYIDCLYFSAITFTTLGYGDFRPLEGLGRILAGSEAFIGAFMMALFIYTFARRTGGR